MSDLSVHNVVTVSGVDSRRLADLLRHSHPTVDSPTYRALARTAPESERNETRPTPGRRLPTSDPFCERPWPAHAVVTCPGSIACGGFLPHDCATPGCMEPEYGVHGPECTGWRIACPSDDDPTVTHEPVEED